MDEFSLIARYFARPALAGERDDVVLGIGDDCALLAPSPGHVMAVSVDTLVAGVHFFPDVDPSRLALKALAVNLSDLAATGATPDWFTLALTLPEANPEWLEAFSGGLSALAAASGIVLVGGDTTRGPLSITIQVMGHVAPHKALRRSGARVGDDIWVSGCVGRAGLGLLIQQARREQRWQPAMTAADGADVDASSWFDPATVFIDALECPEPRLGLGRALGQLASACIDVSDGLLQDLGHVLTASDVGAELEVDAIPVPAWADWQRGLSSACATAHTLRSFALSAGDDYELCFTAPPSRRDEVLVAAAGAGVAVTHIGRIVAGSGIIDAGTGQRLVAGGFRHFSAADDHVRTNLMEDQHD
jgi:thiamine-monophosphate kinase